jgi:hypothetical protein
VHCSHILCRPYTLSHRIFYFAPRNARHRAHIIRPEHTEFPNIVQRAILCIGTHATAAPYVIPLHILPPVYTSPQHILHPSVPIQPRRAPQHAVQHIFYPAYCLATYIIPCPHAPAHYIFPAGTLGVDISVPAESSRYGAPDILCNTFRATAIRVSVPT